MKILVVIDHFPPDVKGGYELRCEEACLWMQERGYEVEVLTTNTAKQNNSDKLKVHRLLEKYPFGMTPKSWSFIRTIFHSIKDNLVYKYLIWSLKPKIIYIWNCASVSRSLLPLMFISKSKILIDVSSSWLLKVYSQHGPIYRFIEHKSKNVIINFLKSILIFLIRIMSLNTIRRKYEIFLDQENVNGYFTSVWNRNSHLELIKSCEKFKVIHTGVNVDHFIFQKKIFDPKNIKFLFVGRITEDKGIFQLLPQFLQLITSFEGKTKLIVVGDFVNKNEQNRINDFIGDNNLLNYVVFEGSQKRKILPFYYHRVDFTIFPSIWDEPFSRVPLESLSCGTPCISTSNPGCKELFDLGVPLIPLSDDVKGLETSIEPFLNNKELHELISLRGREVIEKSFSFDKYMGDINNFFLKKID